MTQDAPFRDAALDAGEDPSRAEGLHGDGPRLAQELVLRVASSLRERAGGWRTASPEALGRFCDAVLSDDPNAAETMLSALLARGVAADALYSAYLSGAALELGRRWDEDEIGFGELGLGMSRLQRILRELGPAFVGGAAPADAPVQGLVAVAPGERHVFGAIMFADHLRRLGWSIRTEIGGDAGALRAAAAEAPLDVLAISIACRVNLGRLSALIDGLRRGRHAPRLIAVGGAFALQAPAAMAQCGADLVASDARQVKEALQAAQERETC